MTDQNLYVMLRWQEREDSEPGDVNVIGIYGSVEQVEARIERIAAANKQYEMKKLSTLYPTVSAGIFKFEVT